METINDMIKSVISSPEITEIVDVVDNHSDVLELHERQIEDLSYAVDSHVDGLLEHEDKITELADVVESHARDLERIAEKLSIDEED